MTPIPLTLFAALLLGLGMPLTAHADDGAGAAPSDDPPAEVEATESEEEDLGPTGKPYDGRGPLLERYEQVRTLTLDDSRSFPANGQVLMRDAMNATFKTGHFMALMRGDGTTAGLVFKGEGQMVFTPPDASEAYQLAQHLDEESLDKPFSEAFLMFTDTTLLELNPEGRYNQPIDGDGLTMEIISPAPFKEIFDDRYELLVSEKWDTGSPTLEFDYIWDSLHPIRGVEGFIFAEFHVEGMKVNKSRGLERPFDWVTYYFNPNGAMEQLEEVSLFGHRWQGTADFEETQLWQSFDRQEHRETMTRGERANKNPELIDVDSIDMNLRLIKPMTQFSDLRDMEAVVTLGFTSRVSYPVKAASFEFLRTRRMMRKWRKTEIQSVTDATTGQEVSWIHARNNLMVELDPPLKPGEVRHVTVAYKADYLQPLDQGAYMLLNTWPWFPQANGNDRTSFKIDICVPKGYMAAGTGTLVKEYEDGGYLCEVWDEPTPIRYPSVIFGKYYRRELEQTEGMPKIRSYALQGRGNVSVLHDTMAQTENIVQIYESFYGPWPFPEIDFVQMSKYFGFGQAPPGLIQVAGRSLDMVGYTSSIDAFYAHELAHQYWGHLVGWKTYHDQWISESFAEYTSGVYRNMLMGNQIFLEELEGWRQQAIMYDDFGPIFMGGRLGRGYTGATYNKGPYMLHMLRSMLGEEKFFAILKLFCGVAQHRNASSQDFFALVEKSMGADLTWFWDQWFYGTGIPSLDVTYTVTKEKGKWVVEGVARQENTDFILPTPFYIKLGRDQAIRQAVVIKGKETPFRFEGLPKKPKSLEVDPFRELLTDKIKVHGG